MQSANDIAVHQLLPMLLEGSKSIKTAEVSAKACVLLIDVIQTELSLHTVSAIWDAGVHSLGLLSTRENLVNLSKVLHSVLRCSPRHLSSIPAPSLLSAQEFEQLRNNANNFMLMAYAAYQTQLRALEASADRAIVHAFLLDLTRALGGPAAADIAAALQQASPTYAGGPGSARSSGTDSLSSVSALRRYTLDIDTAAKPSLGHAPEVPDPQGSARSGGAGAPTLPSPAHARAFSQLPQGITQPGAAADPAVRPDMPVPQSAVMGMGMGGYPWPYQWPVPMPYMAIGMGPGPGPYAYPMPYPGQMLMPMPVGGVPGPYGVPPGHFMSYGPLVPPQTSGAGQGPYGFQVPAAQQAHGDPQAQPASTQAAPASPSSFAPPSPSLSPGMLEAVEAVEGPPSPAQLFDDRRGQDLHDTDLPSPSCARPYVAGVSMDPTLLQSLAVLQEAEDVARSIGDMLHQQASKARRPSTRPGSAGSRMSHATHGQGSVASSGNPNLNKFQERDEARRLARAGPGEGRNGRFRTAKEIVEEGPRTRGNRRDSGSGAGASADSSPTSSPPPAQPSRGRGSLSQGQRQGPVPEARPHTSDGRDRGREQPQLGSSSSSSASYLGASTTAPSLSSTFVRGGMTDGTARLMAKQAKVRLLAQAAGEAVTRAQARIAEAESSALLVRAIAQAMPGSFEAMSDGDGILAANAVQEAAAQAAEAAAVAAAAQTEAKAINAALEEARRDMEETEALLASSTLRASSLGVTWASVTSRPGDAEGQGQARVATQSVQGERTSTQASTAPASPGVVAKLARVVGQARAVSTVVKRAHEARTRVANRTAYRAEAQAEGQAVLDSLAGLAAGEGYLQEQQDDSRATLRSLSGLAGVEGYLQQEADEGRAALRSLGKLAAQAGYLQEAADEEDAVLSSLHRVASAEGYLQEQAEGARGTLDSLGRLAAQDGYLQQEDEDEDKVLRALLQYAADSDGQANALPAQFGKPVAEPAASSSRPTPAMAGLVGQVKALSILAKRAQAAQARVANRAAYRAEAQAEAQAVLDSLAGLAGGEGYLQEQEQDEDKVLQALLEYAAEKDGQRRQAGKDSRSQPAQQTEAGKGGQPPRPSLDVRSPASLGGFGSTSTPPTGQKAAKSPTPITAVAKLARLLGPAKALQILAARAGRAQARVAQRTAFHQDAADEMLRQAMEQEQQQGQAVGGAPNVDAGRASTSATSPARLASLVGPARGLRMLQQKAAAAQARVASRAGYRADAVAEEDAILDALADLAAQEGYLQDSVADEQAVLRALARYAAEGDGTGGHDTAAVMAQAKSAVPASVDTRPAAEHAPLSATAVAKLASLVGPVKALQILAARAGRAQARVAQRTAFHQDAADEMLRQVVHTAQQEEHVDDVATPGLLIPAGSNTTDHTGDHDGNRDGSMTPSSAFEHAMTIKQAGEGQGV